MSAEDRHALARSLFAQSSALTEHVAKVLQMTRFETGTIDLEREWTTVGEIAGSVLNRLKERMAAHRLIVDLPNDLPLVRVDASLIEQALGNLLENGATHTPPGTVIRLSAQRNDDELVVSVVDYGDGLPDGDVEQRLCEISSSIRDGHRQRHGIGPRDLPRDRPPARRQGLGRTRSGGWRRISFGASD